MTQISNASSSLPLTIIANLKAKPGKKPEVFDAVYALLAPTHAEEGCLNHDMHRSTEDPAAVGRLLGHAGPGLKP